MISELSIVEFAVFIAATMVLTNAVCFIALVNFRKFESLGSQVKARAPILLLVLLAILALSFPPQPASPPDVSDAVWWRIPAKEKVLWSSLSEHGRELLVRKYSQP